MKLHHIGIYCTDLESTTAFYCRHFGFRLLVTAKAMEGPVPLRMAWLIGQDGCKLELLERQDKVVTSPDGGSANHMAYTPEDFDQWVAEFLASGYHLENTFCADIAFDAPLASGDESAFARCGPKGLLTKLAFFRDLSGQRVELIDDSVGPL